MSAPIDNSDELDAELQEEMEILDEDEAELQEEMELLNDDDIQELYDLMEQVELLQVKIDKRYPKLEEELVEDKNEELEEDGSVYEYLPKEPVDSDEESDDEVSVTSSEIDQEFKTLTQRVERLAMKLANHNQRMENNL